MSDDINKIINELHIYEKKVLKELEKDENASPEEISQTLPQIQEWTSNQL